MKCCWRWRGILRDLKPLPQSRKDAKETQRRTINIYVWADTGGGELSVFVICGVNAMRLREIATADFTTCEMKIAPQLHQELTWANHCKNRKIRGELVKPGQFWH